jgi:hypothetical protein
LIKSARCMRHKILLLTEGSPIFSRQRCGIDSYEPITATPS